MSETAEAAYVIGEYREPVEGKAVPQERKSAPLSAFLPERDRYLTTSPERYFDRDHAEREWEKMWTKVWLCAGRVSDLPHKGSWFRFDIGRESFIIVRTDEDRVSALYNVCQHRANRLVDDDFGRSAAFVCPYHSWRFDRSGRCTHITDRELFKPEALSGDLDLPRARCETFAGFVFITMNEDAPSLAQYLGEVMDITSGYRTERMEVRNDVSLELACNWKATLDAFSENYHVHMTHQFAMPVTEDKIGQMDFYPGGHSRRIVAIGNPALRRGPETAINASQEALLQAAGIDPARFDGSAHDVRRAIQLAKRAMNGAAGEAYRDLSDNQLTDDWAMNIFPNMHWSMHAEGVLVLRYDPHPTDPNRCTLHIWVLAHPGVDFEMYMPRQTELHEDGRPKRLRVRHDDPDVMDKIGALLHQDIRNTREAQLGLQSRGFKRIRLSEHEQPIMYEHATMDRYLAAE